MDQVKRYKLLKLNFCDADDQVLAVMPCPNCFIKTLNAEKEHKDLFSEGSSDVKESKDTPRQVVCDGCLNGYSLTATLCVAHRTLRLNCNTHDCDCFEPRYNNSPECKYARYYNEFLQNNSSFYTEEQVKALWPTINFEAATTDSIVVSCDAGPHSHKNVKCTNCYGHYFPCGSEHDFGAVALMTYSEYKSQHVASSKLPATFEEYMSMTYRQEEQLIYETWDEQANAR